MEAGKEDKSYITPLRYKLNDQCKLNYKTITTFPVYRRVDLVFLLSIQG